jgi:hypothetical protein
MRSPPNPQVVGSVAMSIWRVRDLIVLIGLSVAACSNGANPGSIEQLVRITLH